VAGGRWPALEALEERVLLAIDVLVNDDVGSNGTAFFTQSETSLVAFGDTVVIGFNDSGSFASTFDKFTGFARSTDGGLSFTDGGTLPTNALGDSGDPVLARHDTSGRIFFATLQSSGSGIAIFHSDNDGATWSLPAQGAPGSTGFQDKPWITVDNFAGPGNGNVYHMVRDFGLGDGIYFYRSTDGGNTFGPSGGTLITQENQGAFVVVGPDHAVYAFWFADTSIQMRKSTDQGLTFGAPITVVSGLSGPEINGGLDLTGIRQGTVIEEGFRSNSFPHAAVDPESGNLYVTYNDNPLGADKADVFLVVSTNGGAGWGSPLRVNDDTTITDQWQPTIAITPSGGKLGVFYYSRQEDPANNLFKYYGRFGNITGASVAFEASFAISDVPSLPEFGRDLVVNPTYMGDYNQAVATNSAFHIVWSDNRDDLIGGAPRKDPDVFYERIDLALVNLGPDVALLEGDVGTTDFVFSLTRDREISSPIIVSFTTADGTAIAPNDYLAQSGSVTFQPGGPATQFITVAVIAESDVEQNETFFVRITGAVGGGVGRSDAVGTILNDDVELTLGDVSVIEGDTGTKDALLTVTALGAVNQFITFGFTSVNETAIAPADYLARGGLGTLTPGTSSATIAVPIVGDKQNEASETFVILLTSSVNARIVDNLGIGTIIDNDPLPGFYVNDAYVTTTQEGLTAAVFAVALDAPSGREVTVGFGTSDGTATDGVDYQGQSGLLTFTPGVTTRLVSVPVFTDGTYTPNLKFFLNLANPTNSNLVDPQGAATIIFAPEPTLEFIIDNGALGYSRSPGGWTTLTNTLAYQLDYDYAAAGNGSATATWSFNDIPNGSYQVFARWIPFSNRATNAPFTILDGTSPVSTVLVNQQVAPAGELSNGITWQSLGTFQTTAGALGVRLANNADGYVIADAVRIVANGIPPQVSEMDVAGFDHSIGTGDVTPALEDGTDFGHVALLTESAPHVFTILNSGNADLLLTGSPAVAIGGAHASDFTIVAQPAALIGPLKKTTFSVVFHPAALGLRTAVVSIANNDDTEHPYQFVLQGTGAEAVPPPPPQALAHNAEFPEDVNADNRVSPRDVLVVINALTSQAQSGAAAPLAATAAAAASETYYVDVSGDGRVTTRDVLMVINYLLSPPASAPSAAGVDAVASALAAAPDGSADAGPPSVDMDAAVEAASGIGGGDESSMLLEPAGVEAALAADEADDPLVGDLEPLLAAL
jgi:hypothetical protein